MTPSRTVSVTLAAMAIATAAGASAAHANSHGDVRTRLVAAGLDNTIALDRCSASYVRFPSSKGGDKGLMLTNGHCHQLMAGRTILTDQPADRAGTIIDANGKEKGKVKAERLIYATLVDSDLALYRLDQTFDQIAKATKAKPLTLRTTSPAKGAKFAMASAFHKQVWHCTLNSIAPNVKEGPWMWHDSLRYDPKCTAKSGVSGSPLIDEKTLEVLGIHNTTNEDGKECNQNNPCEVDNKGKTLFFKKGQSYGQQTFWFTTCIDSKNTLDLKRKGCKLAGGADQHPFP